MLNTRCVSVATDARLENKPRMFQWGLCGLYPLSSPVSDCPSQGPSPTKAYGVFLLAPRKAAEPLAHQSKHGQEAWRLTLEDQSCVLRLDPLSSESGRMKFKPHMRRSSQHELDPGTGGCVSQRIRVPLDTECSVSHAVTDAVRGLTSIYMIGLGLLCPEPCHPDIKD